MAYTDKICANSIIYRETTLDDGHLIHALIKRCPPLDLNSCYHYLLLASHFHETCIVAEHQGQIGGFISAYVHPLQAETLFVWQVAVDPQWRRLGLGLNMLDGLLARPRLAAVQYLETTISPSNSASRQLFESLARKLKAPHLVSDYFTPVHFGGAQHEAEQLHRIGPFCRS